MEPTEHLSDSGRSRMGASAPIEVPLTEQAHSVIAKTIAPGDCVIDATVGNGRDTAFLASCVGSAGHVYGFDIQPEALENARDRLVSQDMDSQVTLFLNGHEEMKNHLPPEALGRVSAIVFNLGYLPGGSKDLTTESSTTIAALSIVHQVLREGGVLCVMCYRGHSEGALETHTVEAWAAAEIQQQRFEISWRDAPSNRRLAPRLLIAVRK